jgi:flagellar hook-associated protein 1
MSLTSTMQIARSALITSQLGLQVTAQNMANAANPGYTRQIALLTALRGRASDPYQIGQGVAVNEVRRQIDDALQRRLWNSNSQEFSSAQQLNVLSQLETILNEGTEFDMSSELSNFFNSWTEATTLLDSQATIVNQGGSLASFIRNMQSDLVVQRQQLEEQIDASVVRADSLLSEIASINSVIASNEIGEAEAGSLRDRRDQIVTELAQLMDVTVVETDSGGYDIYSGSTPIVQGGRNRGIEISRVTEGETLTVRVELSADSTPLPITSGSIGGLLASRDGAIDATLEKLDDLASQLIFEVNKLQAVGANTDWLTTTSSNLQVGSTDQTLALNDPNNTTFANLPFAASNGSFTISVRDESGTVTSTRQINIDLDGLTNAGVPGFSDDTSAADILSQINAAPSIGVSASFDPSGRLVIDTDPGLSFSFADDTSDVLATMGVNSFFEGTSASTITVRDNVTVMLGKMEGDKFIANGTALAIGNLTEEAADGLGGLSISKFWAQQSQEVAVKTSSARTNANADRIVRQSLSGQRAAVSGVSIDEESINLLSYQRQFQASAQVITTAQQMFDTLLSLV